MFATEWSCGGWTMALLAVAFAIAVIIEAVKRASKPEIAKQTGGSLLGALLKRR